MITAIRNHSEVGSAARRKRKGVFAAATHLQNLPLDPLGLSTSEIATSAKEGGVC